MCFYDYDYTVFNDYTMQYLADRTYFINDKYL